MKFGKQLEEYELPEWRGHYIPYKKLKSELQEIACVSSVGPSPVATPVPGTPRVRSISRLFARNPEDNQTLGDGSREESWRATLFGEALRVGDFVHRGLEGLEAQLRDLEKMAETLSKKRLKGYRSEDGTDKDLGSPDNKAEKKGKKDKTDKKEKKGKKEKDGAPMSAEGEEFLELRVLEAMDLVAEGGARLRGFAELNHAALYKILKKHDKILQVSDGLGVMFPRLVKQTRLGETARFDELDAELRRLSLLSSQTQGLDASAEVARLAAGLGLSRAGGAGAGHSGARNTELVLSFFLGCSVALFLCIGVLLALPESQPHTYSAAYFLTPMPVFRVVFSVLLALWCLGAVARTCDKADINHMFILNVDPRCRVTPEFFFSRAAALTTLWILIFGMYVVDYKWRIVPPLWSYEGYNERSSFHFVIYPVVLLVLTILGMVWPSKICRSRYKTSVLRAVARTASAPFHPVDFADNIIGDILTSLAKPLQDLPAAICYLASEHPQPEEAVRRFSEKGDTCSFETHHVLLPVIGGLPYVFRAMQCLRRYRDTRETRNLWNFGKYMSSLLVVLVSSVWYGDPIYVVIVSVIATVYAGVWDVILDWGLGSNELFGNVVHDMAQDLSCGQPSGDQMTSSMTSSKSLTPPIPERQFARPVYVLCIAIDILARSTWALTLLPITIVSDSLTGRVILVSLISSIEILRRSMWAVLRIEHEQVANASGFRALLWVPSKLHVLNNNSGGACKRSPCHSLERRASAKLGIRAPLLEA